MNDVLSMICDWNRILLAQAASFQHLSKGMYSYNQEFLQPLISAAKTFQQLESAKVFEREPLETMKSYIELSAFNHELLSRYSNGTLSISDDFLLKELRRFYTAWNSTVAGEDQNGLRDFFVEQEEMLRRVLSDYPQAILDIKAEYGFHFENYPESLVAETERFELRKIHPSKEGVKTDDSLKPVLIIPPFVLGANILSFLPKEQKSYAHSFADKSIPTYIRIMKDIQTNPAVQTMSLEEDVLDIQSFCRQIQNKHKKKVTLNGYCQGGFTSLCALLTRKLDNLVDALITCVAPIDGTRSKGLGSFLSKLPQEFNNLDYGTKTLANGNKIADGNLMGWVYKLKSIEDSGPIISFVKDMMMLDHRGGRPRKINKTVAALNYWLQNERSDLPLSVTEMSYNSFNIPITDDGTLPITIFGKKLNINEIKPTNADWLLCYGESDDLVEKEVALAPLDFIDVEVTSFPKGHVAIATSWSHPDSQCALDKVFGEDKRRGPVRFHLDLDGIH